MKCLAAVVVKQLRLPPLVEEQVFVAVVVVVAPDRAHRYAGARQIHIGDADIGRNIAECSVAQVAIEGVAAAFFAVHNVNVLPAVAVEVHDGDSGPHRRDLFHDVAQFRVESGSLMDETDAGRFRRLLEIETVSRQRLRFIAPWPVPQFRCAGNVCRLRAQPAALQKKLLRQSAPSGSGLLLVP